MKAELQTDDSWNHTITEDLQIYKTAKGPICCCKKKDENVGLFIAGVA